MFILVKLMNNFKKAIAETYLLFELKRVHH